MKGFTRTGRRCKLLSALCICVFALSACDTGSGSINPPVFDDTDVVDDPSVSGDSVRNGVAIISSDSVKLQFDITEDTLLRGRFYSPDELAAGPVAIRSLPQHGLLTLRSDGSEFIYDSDVDYWGVDGFEYDTFSGLRVSVVLNVQAVNDAPVLSAELPRVAEQGRLFNTNLIASDVDDEVLRFSASNLPAWLRLDVETGALFGLPAQSDIGFSENIKFTVTDGGGLFDELMDIRFEVIDINDAPTLNLTQLPTELKGRESVTANVFPDDPDGDSVTLTIESNPFVSGETENGLVTFTAADINDVMQVNVVIKATDRLGRIAREIVPLTLYPLTSSGRGQTLSGSKNGRGVHLVILGDGYAIDQQTLFREHAEDFIASMSADEGIVAHLGAFNIHMVSTVSAQSGADDNEQVDNRDTAFDSSYSCGGIARLICANTLALFEAALSEYPEVDQIILLVNDKRYGGSGNSGGSVAIASAYSLEIALHEMGHSLADLADEYVDNQLAEALGSSSFQEGRFANITASTKIDEIPWKHWIDFSKPLPQSPGDEGVGLFEGGFYRGEGLYRPTFNSRMRSFDASFGPVNSEQWVLRLYELTEGIRGVSPAVADVKIAAGESQEFVVSPLFGSAVQTVQWHFNGTPVSTETPNRFLLTPDVGRHTVTVTVSDISGAIKQPLPHAGVFSWTWTIEVS